MQPCRTWARGPEKHCPKERKFAVNLIELWPLALFLVLSILTVVFMLLLSACTGQRHSERATGEIYESGVVSTGSARVRFDAKFYLIAMFFVVFDLEAVFIYAYAVAFRELGWSGYIEIVVFVFILGAALFYLWRVGALQWGPKRGKARRSPGASIDMKT
jgi:NADH-quinone oxidoreductase subunit A